MNMYYRSNYEGDVPWRPNYYWTGDGKVNVWAEDYCWSTLLEY